jgi:outer membrane protein TolC
VESRTEQLCVEKGRYHAGKAKNLDILVIERDLIQARVDDATARIGYIQALTSFFASEGTLLERRGITLEEEKN